MGFYVADTACFCDGTTGRVFGPLFEDGTQADDMIEWLDELAETYLADQAAKEAVMKFAPYPINFVHGWKAGDPRSIDGWVDWTKVKAAYDEASEAEETPMTRAAAERGEIADAALRQRMSL